MTPSSRSSDILKATNVAAQCTRDWLRSGLCLCCLILWLDCIAVSSDKHCHFLLGNLVIQYFAVWHCYIRKVSEDAPELQTSPPTMVEAPETCLSTVQPSEFTGTNWICHQQQIENTLGGQKTSWPPRSSQHKNVFAWCKLESTWILNKSSKNSTTIEW